MYLSTRSLAAAGRREAEGVGSADETRPAIGPNVWYLGLTSLFTDISSEMVAAVLPLYLTLYFGFGPLLFGAFDGAYQGLTALTAVITAVGADRTRRHKLTAGIGYAISAVCTLGLVVAQSAWSLTVGALYLTRLGKGIRTAPRDALISMAAAPGWLGRAFGIHRAFDTVGAVAGPVLASLLLLTDPDPSGYQPVFTVGFLVAVVGVAVFVLFVQGAPALAAGPSETDGTDGTTAAGGDGALTPPAPSALTRLRRRAGHALANRRFRLVLVAGGSLALVRPGDALLYLSYQREAAVNVALFPLLFSGASVVFLLAAAPLGIVADRIGRLRVYLIGEAAVAGSLAVLATGIREPAALVVLLFLVGLSYAATDAVLAAMASEALGERWRTTGLAVLAAVVAAGRFVASTGFGALWERYGGTVAARVYLVGAVVVLVLGFLLLRVERADESRDGPDGHDGPNGQDGSDRDRKADVLEAMA